MYFLFWINCWVNFNTSLNSTNNSNSTWNEKWLKTVTYIARWISSVFSRCRRRSYCVCFARVFLTDKIMIHMFLSVPCTRITISRKVISRTSRQTFQPFFVSLGFCGRSECKRLKWNLNCLKLESRFRLFWRIWTSFWIQFLHKFMSTANVIQFRADRKRPQPN